MRTIARAEFSLTVDTLVLTLGLELATDRLAVTWSAFDVYRAEQRDKARFYRPEEKAALLNLDDRARLAEGA